MLFFSDKPEKNGPKVAARLGKELGAGPLPFTTITDGERFRPSSFGEVLSEAVDEKLGKAAKVRPMYTFCLEATGARPLEIRVAIANHGGLTAIGSIVYATRLAKRPPGPVAADDERLAPVKRRLKKFLRTEYELGKTTIAAPRRFELRPDGDGAVLVAGTLPKPGWFGLSTDLGAARFIELAEAIEAAL
jgi:hypothetical protein